ncbi:PBSX family phage terminase large subunit, partial [Bacillus thuringiensis]
DYGIRLHPITKKRKVEMIENVYDLLSQGRFFILDIENNKIFYEEHKKYQWEAKTLKTPNPEVIKVDDHTCDAFQYYVNDNLQKLNLK